MINFLKNSFFEILKKFVVILSFLQYLINNINLIKNKRKKKQKNHIFMKKERFDTESLIVNFEHAFNITNNFIFIVNLFSIIIPDTYSIYRITGDFDYSLRFFVMGFTIFLFLFLIIKFLIKFGFGKFKNSSKLKKLYRKNVRNTKFNLKQKK